MENPSQQESAQGHQNVTETRGERAKNTSKESLRAIGNVAVGLLLPLATEVIQRRNVDRRMREQYIIDHPHISNATRAERAFSAFRGSVEDFKKINQDIKKRKTKQRGRRK